MDEWEKTEVVLEFIQAVSALFVAIMAAVGVNSWRAELVLRRKLEVLDSAYKDLTTAIDSINFMRDFWTVAEGINGVYPNIKLKFDSCHLNFMRLAEAKTQLEIVDLNDLALEIEKIRVIPHEILAAARTLDNNISKIQNETNPEFKSRMQAQVEDCDRKVYYRVDDYYQSSLQTAKDKFIKIRRKLMNT
ncbi:MAG: hypothetical protein Q8J69_08820 [Sphingobacteriaceae bacterium]|nr:hypothetical protein [Sphingobacteriaceae bacterium]